MSCKVIKVYSYRDSLNKINIIKNTAKELASGGKHVAIIDLNFVSPAITHPSSYGIVKYLYNKQFNIKDNVFLPVHYIKEDNIFIVSVGECDFHYIKHLSALNYKKIYENDFVGEFIKEIIKFYNLDYVLINTAPGFSIEAQYALMRIDGDVIMLIDPNEPNKEAVETILYTIKSENSVRMIFTNTSNSEEDLEKARNFLNISKENKVIFNTNKEDSLAPFITNNVYKILSSKVFD